MCLCGFSKLTKLSLNKSMQLQNRKYFEVSWQSSWFADERNKKSNLLWNLLCFNLLLYSQCTIKLPSIGNSNETIEIEVFFSNLLPENPLSYFPCFIYINGNVFWGKGLWSSQPCSILIIFPALLAHFNANQIHTHALTHIKNTMFGLGLLFYGMF
jgi:hypothetical protein